MRIKPSLASLVLICLVPAVFADAKTLSERWYVVQMGAQRVGYVHARQTQLANQDIVTRETMVMKIKRGNEVVETTIESTTTEVAKTGLFHCEHVTRSASATVTQRFQLRGKKGIDYVIAQNGQEKKGTLPAGDDPLLGPEQARLFFKARRDKGDKSFSYQTFDPSSGMRTITIGTTVKGDKDLEVLGRVVPTVVLEKTNSAYPTLTVTEYVDVEGRLVKAVTDMGGGLSFEMLLADRDIALAKVDPPELVASSVITPDKPIRGPRRIRTASYLLTLKAKGQVADNPKPKWTLTLPTAGYQTATVTKAGDVQVDVNIDKAVASKDDKPNQWHSKPSTICDSEDKKIIELVAEALKGLDADSKTSVKAERLRSFVQRYVRSKDLSVGFGHASEVARTRQGDCTEHAVLLAAMLRAAGIPSRGVTGLVYADQFVGKNRVFVYHMWTQAWIEEKDGSGHWLDVDATLPRRAFDAAHIALASSVLNEMADNGSGNDMVKLLPLLGRLEVKVLEAK